jgi:hypothetical protein
MLAQTTPDPTTGNTAPCQHFCLPKETDLMADRPVTTPLRTSDSDDCPQILLDRSLRVRAANHAFRDLFHVAPDISHGTYLFETRNSPWNQPVIHALLQEAWSQTESVVCLVDMNVATVGPCRLRIEAERRQSPGSRMDLLCLSVKICA